MSDDGDIDESTRFFLVNIFHVEGVVIHGGSTFLIFDLLIKKKSTYWYLNEIFSSSKFFLGSRAVPKIGSIFTTNFWER